MARNAGGSRQGSKGRRQIAPTAASSRGWAEREERRRGAALGNPPGRRRRPRGGVSNRAEPNAALLRAEADGEGISEGTEASDVGQDEVAGVAGADAARSRPSRKRKAGVLKTRDESRTHFSRPWRRSNNAAASGASGSCEPRGDTSADEDSRDPDDASQPSPRETAQEAVRLALCEESRSGTIGDPSPSSSKAATRSVAGRRRLIPREAPTYEGPSSSSSKSATRSVAGSRRLILREAPTYVRPIGIELGKSSRRFGARYGAGAVGPHGHRLGGTIGGPSSSSSKGAARSVAGSRRLILREAPTYEGPSSSSSKSATRSVAGSRRLILREAPNHVRPPERDLLVYCDGWSVAEAGLDRAYKDMPAVLRECRMEIVRMKELNAQSNEVGMPWLRFLSPEATNQAFERYFKGVVNSTARAAVSDERGCDDLEAWPDSLGGRYIYLIGFEDVAVLKKIVGDRVMVATGKMRSLYVRPDDEKQTLGASQRCTFKPTEVSLRQAGTTRAIIGGPWTLARGAVRSEAKGKAAVEASRKKGTYVATLHTALTYCGLERVPVFGPRSGNGVEPARGPRRGPPSESPHRRGGPAGRSARPVRCDAARAEIQTGG